MLSLINVSRAQVILARSLKEIRLEKGFTQEGLSKRSGVSLPTLRKFEQTGKISLESFLKLSMVLECLEAIVNAAKPSEKSFNSIQEVLDDKKTGKPKRGWRK